MRCEEVGGCQWDPQVQVVAVSDPRIATAGQHRGGGKEGETSTKVGVGWVGDFNFSWVFKAFFFTGGIK